MKRKEKKGKERKRKEKKGKENCVNVILKKCFFSIGGCGLLLLLLFAGCSQDFQDDGASKNSPDVTSRVVSLKQAEDFANKAIGAIVARTEGQTTKTEDAEIPVKSSNSSRTISNIKTIHSDNGIPVLYVVNFDEDRGFMVVSADKEASNPVLAFNYESNVDIDALSKDAIFLAYLNEKKEQIAANLESGIDENNQGYQIWDAMIGDEEKEVFLELANIDEAENLPKTKGRHRNSLGYSYEPPWYNSAYSLWGQGTGYNANAPYSGIPIGCPAVAIGILCKVHRFPAIYDYNNMPASLNTSAPNAISKMFRDIADKIPGYIWSYSGSGATPSAIHVALKNIGYKNAMFDNYKFATVYNEIKAWRPVLLGGYRTAYGGGHIWIADGYQEQVWKITTTKKFLGIIISTSVRYEFVDMIYMNWGWNGQGNGWVDQEDWNSSVNGSYNTQKKMYTNLYPIINAKY
ncbi:MAG: C10 family peptidase [Prevotellaceae bacterium]|jgi:hypothetical protein|nr:C10 family peptidase [Prevotellaceae bacterium]